VRKKESHTEDTEIAEGTKINVNEKGFNHISVNSVGSSDRREWA
jgi:hypothetical protein